jgi:hypothetical protein
MAKLSDGTETSRSSGIGLGCGVGVGVVDLSEIGEILRSTSGITTDVLLLVVASGEVGDNDEGDFGE